MLLAQDTKQYIDIIYLHYINNKIKCLTQKAVKIKKNKVGGCEEGSEVKFQKVWIEKY